MLVNQLLKSRRLLSDQVTVDELRVILTELERILRHGIKGDIAEFGCYVGTTSIFLQQMIQQLDRRKSLHVYDSFEGLPAKVSADASPAGQQFVEGSLSATKSQFVRNFQKAALPLPIITKGWFEELASDQIPNAVALAFLDGDYYWSVKAPLRLLEGRMSHGAVIIVDDYQNEALPGAAKAVDEWLHAHAEVRMQVIHSLAVMRFP